MKQEKLHKWVGLSFYTFQNNLQGCCDDSDNSYKVSRTELGDSVSGHFYYKGDAVLFINPIRSLQSNGSQMGESTTPLREYLAKTEDIPHVYIF